MYGRGKKLRKPKIQNKKRKEKEKEENTDRIGGIIRNIWILFETEEENKKIY